MRKETALLLRPPGRTTTNLAGRVARWKLDSPVTEPPVDLLLTAAKLSKLGFGCKLMDYPAEGLNWGALTADLVRLSPSLVAISSSLNTLTVDLEAVREARRIVPDATTILVGRDLLYHEAAIHWDCRELTGIVSEPFRFASARTASRSLKALEFQSRRDANVIKVSSFSQKSVLDINKVPRLPFELLSLANYRIRTSHTVRLPVLASIGCVHACAHCVIPRLCDGVTHLRRPSGIVKEMLHGATELGKTRFELVADNLTAPRPWWNDLMSELSKARRKLLFAFRACDCEFPEDLAEGLRAAGCEMITLVLPAALNRAASELDWGPEMTEEAVVKKVRTLRKAGIGVCLSFVIGLLPEDTETPRRAARLAAESRATSMEFLTPDGARSSGPIHVTKGECLHGRSSHSLGDADEDASDAERALVRAVRCFWLRPRALRGAMVRFGPRVLTRLASVLVGL